MNSKTLREQLFSLPVPERLSLVGELWDSIAEDQQSLGQNEEHARVVDERLAAHEANPADVVPWNEAKADILKQIQQRTEKRP